MLPIETAPPKRRGMIASLQAGRAFAALAVLLHHSVQSIQAHIGPVPKSIEMTLSHGNLGVDFFFVLSGFIIYLTNAERASDPGWLAHYVRSRIVRIYPPYLPIGIAMAAAYLLWPALSSAQRDWGWLPTLTLFPAGTPALSVAWSLQHEITFYAIMGAALYFRQVLAAALLWAAAILLFRWSIPLAMINLEFLFGTFAAWCYLTGKFRFPVLLTLAGLAAMVSFFLLGSDDYRVLFGLGMAAILLPIIRLESDGRLRVPAFLVRAGAESYALYLLHLPFVVLAVRACARLNLPWHLALVTLTLASILLSKIYYRAYEQPILRRYGSRTRKKLVRVDAN